MRWWPILAIAGLLVGTLPATLALHGNIQPPVTACGRVLNEVGWPLAGVQVTAVGLGVQSSDHLPSPQTTTNATGDFTLRILPDRYEFAFVDPQGPTARLNAVYAATQFLVSGNVGQQRDACGAGLVQSKPIGVVTLAAPSTGFLEADAEDSAVPESLGGGRAETHVGPASWTGAATVAGASTKLTCPLNLPVTVNVTKPDHMPAAGPEFTCQKNNGHRAVQVWRAPVAVTGEVADADTGGAIEAASVAASPRTLAPRAGHPYVLAASSAANGSYALTLPWDDTFDVSLSARGYVAEADTLPVSEADLGAGIQRDLDLARLRFAVPGRVTEFGGSGVAAHLEFTGPDGLATVATTDADAAGDFTLPLAQGAYDVLITAPGKNDRSCDLDLSPEGLASFTPARCLRLLSDGTGEVSGLVLDDLLEDAGVPGVTVDVEGTSTATGADGRYAFEAPAGDVTLALSRNGYAALSRPESIDLDEVQALDDATLARSRVAIEVQVLDVDTGAAVDAASVTVRLRSPTGDLLDESAADADASGRAQLAITWSRLGTALDAGDLAIEANRTSGSPWYENATCVLAFELDPDALPGPIPCALAALPGLATPVGPILDAHTGLPLADVQVAADAPDAPCDAPAYACAAATGADGRALLRLAEGRTYTVSASRQDYQAPADASDVVPGLPVFADLGLARTVHVVDVHAADAHTDAAVAAVPLSADGDGFVCDPGFGGFTCSVASDPQGSAELRLPWGSFVTAAAAGAFDVHHPDGLAGPPDDVEEAVRFEAASRPLTVAAGAGPLAETLLLLRQAGDPITGRVTDFDRDVVAGSEILATAEREGFRCDPALHDAAAPGFPHCARQAAAGPYALLLPHGSSENHTWTLNATGPDHFDEVREEVHLGDLVDLELWPPRFDLVVVPTSDDGVERLANAIACVQNLDANLAHPDAWAGSLPAVPEFCAGNGPDAEPIVFDDVAWSRSDADDEGDRFLIRVTVADHAPAAKAVVLGPADPSVDVPLSPLVPGGEDGLLHGTVADASTPLPLPVEGAEVCAAQAGLCVARATTNAAGAYVLPVPPGDYDVSAAHPAYAPVSPQTATLNPNVVPVPGEAQVDFQLPRLDAPSIVRVRDALSGTALEGIEVSALGAATGASASCVTAPAPGGARCALALPAWDRYALHSAPGAPAVLPTVADVPPGGAAIELAAVDPVAPLDDLGVLEGQVRDASTVEATPLAGAEVCAAQAGACVGRTNTDAAGRYQLLLPPGAYDVAAAKAGFAPSSPLSVAVGAPPALAQADFDLARVAAPTVARVREALGNAPLPGVTVTALGLATHESASCTTQLASGVAECLLPLAAWDQYLFRSEPGASVVVPAVAAVFPGGGTVELLAVTAPALPPCVGPGPQVCQAAGHSPGPRIASLAADAAGTWILAPPQAAVIEPQPLAAGAPVDLSGYGGPHDGTWTIAFLPDAPVPQGGYTVTAAIQTSPGQERTFLYRNPVAVPAFAQPQASAPGVLLLNVHVPECAAWIPAALLATCDGRQLPDPGFIQRVRFFV